MRWPRGGEHCWHQWCMMFHITGYQTFCLFAEGLKSDLQGLNSFGVWRVHTNSFASHSCSYINLIPLSLLHLLFCFLSLISCLACTPLLLLLRTWGKKGNEWGDNRRQKRKKTRHLVNHLADKNRWLSHPHTSSILLQGKIFIGLPQNEALIIWFPCMVALSLITSKYYAPYAFIFTD